MRNNIIKIQRSNPALAKTIEDRGGFITTDDVPALVAIDRSMLALVRCGAGRFLTPIDSLTHFLGIIEKHAEMVKSHTGQLLNAGTDYVRDVSIMHNVTCN